MDLLSPGPSTTLVARTSQAIARGVLEAGARVVAAYPGAPATDVVESLLSVAKQAGIYVEWSVNEKVAFEVATGASWAGQRALVAMKMSGLNVAADSLLSVAHSGAIGGLVIFVTDDVGATCGMVEQDSRYYAQLAGLPMLDIASADEAKAMTRSAFEISERAGCPVFLRATNDVMTMVGEVSCEALDSIPPRPSIEWNPARYTKASARWCLDQHRAALERLEVAGRLADEFNPLSPAAGPWGVVASGIAWEYLRELRDRLGLKLSLLKVGVVHPLPADKLRALLDGVERLLVLEELDPIIEIQVRALSAPLGRPPAVLGKASGLLPRVGRFTREDVRRAVGALLGTELPRPVGPALPPSGFDDRSSPVADNGSPGGVAARPTFAFDGSMTFCPGCPHRATYYALNAALRQLGLGPKEVITTGDIGCTIIGIHPPFETCWTEVAMGASIGLAQGLLRADVAKPVIATIGDGTFFHAGIPPLINAVNLGANVTVVILDNEGAAMTGLQPSASTGLTATRERATAIDIARVVQGLGVSFVRRVDPYDVNQTREAIVEAIRFPGAAVVVARRACVVPLRQSGFPESAEVIEGRCIGLDRCRPSCLEVLGCPALLADDGTVKIDAGSCAGCGLCASVCPERAIARVRAAADAPRPAG